MDDYEFDVKQVIAGLAGRIRESLDSALHHESFEQLPGDLRRSVNDARGLVEELGAVVTANSVPADVEPQTAGEPEGE